MANKGNGLGGIKIHSLPFIVSLILGIFAASPCGGSFVYSLVVFPIVVLIISFAFSSYKKDQHVSIIANLILNVIIYLAVVLVIASIPVVGCGNPLGSQFLINKNFSWHYLAYNHSTGNLSLDLSQNTGTNWVSTQIIFVPEGTQSSNGVPVISWNNSAQINGGMPSAEKFNVTIPISGPTQVGSYKYGQIWARYQIISSGAYYYVKIGSITLQAV